MGCTHRHPELLRLLLLLTKPERNAKQEFSSQAEKANVAEQDESRGSAGELRAELKAMTLHKINLFAQIVQMGALVLLITKVT